MSTIPNSCRECDSYSACTAPYYGSSTCKHEKAIVDAILADTFYNSNGGEENE